MKTPEEIAEDMRLEVARRGTVDMFGVFAVNVSFLVERAAAEAIRRDRAERAKEQAR